MNKLFPLLIVCLLWCSCSDNTEYEILSSEEILPQAQGNYDYSNDSLDVVQDKLNSTQEVLIQLFPDISFDDENILKSRKTLFIPNRLGYKIKEETFFTKDSIPYHYLSWEFEDSLQTVNAFYNWLDCFGEKCNSIRIQEEINGSKEAFIIWVSDSKIIYLGSSKYLSKQTWQPVFFNDLNNEWNYIIQQAPRGKMKWTIAND